MTEQELTRLVDASTAQAIVVLFRLFLLVVTTVALVFAIATVAVIFSGKLFLWGARQTIWLVQKVRQQRSARVAV